MGTWTIYTAGADLVLLNTILNGVAMICNQTAFVWGFAMVASMWRLIATNTAATVHGVAGGAGALMAKGSFGTVIPLVLALLLTSPGMRCNVQVESTLTGAVTAVNNVPFVIAIIPAEGSRMANGVGQLVTQAFSNANPSYNYLASNGNGFLDPMKRLLGARTTVQRLSGIDSEIRSLVSSCLGSDAGINYAAVHAAVLNAGNTGASAAQSLDINGATPTAIGALLYQAASNTTGVAPNISNGNPQQILSCHDAALQVQSDIGAALQSAEFMRTVQGAVNGLDQPAAGADYSMTQFTAEYTALRKWSSVAGNLAGGQQQANAEAINFLFAEEVTNALNCLQADGPNKAACEASMIQANEVERNNIQAAANEVPMLQYSGSFGNYMLALIIGLGPVIVMFMMFAGVGADKSMKTAVHIMVWPLLVTNVGAELVNAMISLQFSNFMAAISQGGFLSLATMATAYKELSLQVGTGSHIMASLPVIMSMIFALGETAALVSVAREMQPKGSEVGETMAPSPTASAPLTRQSSPVQIAQGTGFSRVQQLGSLDAVSGSMQFANMTREASRGISDAETRQHTLSEGRTLAAQWEQSFSSGDYSRWGLSRSEGEALKEVYDRSLRTSHGSSTSVDATSQRQNSNSTEAGVSAGAGVGLGARIAQVGVDGSSKTAASDTLGATVGGARNDSADRAAALDKALHSDVAQQLERSHGGDLSSNFRKAQSVAHNYQQLTSRSDTHTDSRQEALKAGSGFVGAQMKIGGDEIAHQVSANRDYRRFQLDQGHRFDRDPSTQAYREQAERDMDSGVTDSLSGNPEARAATIRTRAALLQYADESASTDDRFKALKFLTDGARAMTHIAFNAPTGADLQRHNATMANPQDHTGVAADLEKRKPSLSRAPEHLTPMQGAAEFKDDVLSDVNSGVVTVGNKVQGYLDDAEGSGLSQHGPGTFVRTVENSADNAKSGFRAAGRGSRVTFGDRPSELESGPPEAAPKPASAAGAPESGSE
jgi:conjugal transfer mating pair stabilization protein TraG